MARIRTIKPEFWESEKVGALSLLARLTFIGLISLADDEGRGRATIAFLLGRLHPYGGVTINELSEVMVEIDQSGLVQTYEVGDGCHYYAIPGFKDNQYIEKPSKSKIPTPPTRKRSGNIPLKVGDTSGIIPPWKGREGKGKERKGMDIAATTPPLEKVKPLTGVQKVMRAFKEAKEIDADDAHWDSINFKRFLRAATDVLNIFGGEADAAIMYVLVKGQELDDRKLTDWGLEAIARAAATDGRVQDFINRGIHGPENIEMGTDRLDGPRRGGGTTSSRSLAGDALRAIESNGVRAQKSIALDGPRSDQTFDDEPFS